MNNKIDGLNDYLLEMAKEVNEAILKDDFEIVEITEYTSNIKVFGHVAQIWITNDPEKYCRLYSVLIGSNTVYLPEHTFNNPLVCFEKVTSPKGDYLQKLRKEKLSEIVELKKELRKMKVAKSE